MSQMISACFCGRSRIVEELIAQNHDPNEADGDGNTPLLVCSEVGFRALAVLLLDNRANANQVEYSKDVRLPAYLVA